MLNLTPSEPLVLVKKLPCFDDLVEMYVLLASPLHLCVKDLIICGPLNALILCSIGSTSHPLPRCPIGLEIMVDGVPH